MIFISALLISAFTTIALIPVLSCLAVHLHILDIPDERKIHSRPIPRSGGLAMALGAIIPIVLWLPLDDSLKAIMLGTAVVVVFGFIDDSKTLSYLSKFAAQITAALIVTCYGGVWIRDLGSLLPHGFHLPAWIGIPLTLVVIVGVTNAINLSDGLDGLAGGISIMIFICIAYLAYLAGDLKVVLLSIAVTGAIFGFLRFNTHPATLFMGDAGSQFLGFLAICLCLKITQVNHGFNKLLPMMMLGMPILDTLSVAHGRIVRGKSPFRADRSHLHYRFMKLGLSHSETVLTIYALQAFMVISACIMRRSSEWLILISCLCFDAIVLIGLAEAQKSGRLIRRRSLTKSLELQDRIRRGTIKTSFRIFEIGLCIMFGLTAMLPIEVPVYVSEISIGLIALVVLTWSMKKKWIEKVSRFGFYLFIPYGVYLSDMDAVPRLGSGLADIYNLSFAVLVIFIVLTLKFTLRKKGFKVTPLDFIVLFIALVVPNLLGGPIGSNHMSLVAAKIIVFYYSYEVLAGELRGNYEVIAVVLIAVLGIASLRGLLCF